MEVTLRLTEKQATVITTALDLYSRVLIGQVENVEEVLRWTYPKLSHPDERYFWPEGSKYIPKDKLQTARLLLNSVKEVLWGFPANASHGIHNPEVHDNARQAFDILQVIRNGVALAQNPKGGIQVCYDEPRQTSNEDPLATIEVRL